MFQCKQCTLSNLNVSIKVDLKYKKKKTTKKTKKTRNVIILLEKINTSLVTFVNKLNHDI